MRVPFRCLNDDCPWSEWQREASAAAGGGRELPAAGGGRRAGLPRAARAPGLRRRCGRLLRMTRAGVAVCLAGRGASACPGCVGETGASASVPGLWVFFSARALLFCPNGALPGCAGAWACSHAWVAVWVALFLHLVHADCKLLSWSRVTREAAAAGRPAHAFGRDAASVPG